MKIHWIHSVGLGEGEYRTGGWSSPPADLETLGTLKNDLKLFGYGSVWFSFGIFFR